MAIMILADQGKLRLDDTLDQYCPEFPAYARTIHIRDLLHHTAGLPDYEALMVGKIGDDFFRSSKGPPAAHEFTSAEVLKTLSRQPKLKFTPGSRFEYSNSGYEVLGQIVERVSGKRYAEFLKEHIFDPAGMRDTLVLDERKHAGSRLAPAYGKRNGRWEDISYSPENYEYGDGGVESTGNDLFRWDQALYGGRLVRRATLDLAFTAGRSNDGKVIETHFFAHPSAYGFGWFVSSDNGALAVEHGGDWSGYRTHIIREPSRRLAAIVLTNSSNDDVSRIAHRMVEIAGK
jgi:CubicO group peptidase (beta-lactamase class C family)